MDTSMTTINKLASELRTIHRDDNDGPRLIAEMIEQNFPELADLIAERSGVTNELRHRVNELESEIEELQGRLNDRD